jgi:uncharacterized protein YecE (DUF72 family)
LQYHIGCSGWSYSAWQGTFYPLNLDNSRWLNYYTQLFDFDYVEIDSSFYRILNEFMVRTGADNNAITIYKRKIKIHLLVFGNII